MADYFPEVRRSCSHDDQRGVMDILYEGPSLNAKILKMTTSKRGALRGFHYQRPPLMQKKKIYILEGEIQDVCLECEPDGKPTGRYFEKIVSANHGITEITIPSNWAHAYLTLSAVSKVLYVCDQFYGEEMSLNPLSHFKGWKITINEMNISEKDLT